MNRRTVTGFARAPLTLALSPPLRERGLFYASARIARQRRAQPSPSPLRERARVNGLKLRKSPENSAFPRCRMEGCTPVFSPFWASFGGVRRRSGVPKLVICPATRSHAA